MGVNIKGVNYKWLKPAEIRKAKTQKELSLTKETKNNKNICFLINNKMKK